MSEHELIKVDPQEATDVSDMIEALVRQRHALGDVALYRAIVALVLESRELEEATP